MSLGCHFHCLQKQRCQICKYESSNGKMWNDSIGSRSFVVSFSISGLTKVRQIIQVTSFKTSCIRPPLQFATLVGEYAKLPVYFCVVAKASPKPSAFFCFVFLLFNKTPIITAAAARSWSTSMAKRTNCVYIISLNW